MLNDYLAVEVEMTGLDAKTDRILEIGAVRVKEKRIDRTFSRMIRQQEPLDERITALTGITDQMAASGSELDTAMADFLEFAGDLIWIGHSIMQDYKFVRQWEVNHRIKRQCFAVDTLKIARKCLPELEKKTLDFLCGHFKIIRGARHRALEDALAAQVLYETLEEKFFEKEPGLFAGRELQYRVKRQTPATPRQKKYLKDLAEYHNIELDLSAKQLTRSEASRLTDQIIRQYGKRQVK